MIEIRNLNKKFGDQVIFDHFSTDIPTGSFTVIKGPSGKGKSTLLHMIGRLEKIDEGMISLDGVDILKEYSRKEYLGKKVGFIFQNYVLMEDETVYENMMTVPKHYRTEMSVEEALQIVGLPGVQEKKVYQLSGGEQQRVAIARLLTKQCDVILADEPTGSLDPVSANMVVQLLKQMQDAGKTIIVVTHADIFDAVADNFVTL